MGNDQNDLEQIYGGRRDSNEDGQNEGWQLEIEEKIQQWIHLDDIFGLNLKRRMSDYYLNGKIEYVYYVFCGQSNLCPFNPSNLI
jgi:hypothetical protein